MPLTVSCVALAQYHFSVVRPQPGPGAPSNDAKGLSTGLRQEAGSTKNSHAFTKRCSKPCSSCSSGSSIRLKEGCRPQSASAPPSILHPKAWVSPGKKHHSMSPQQHVHVPQAGKLGRMMKLPESFIHFHAMDIKDPRMHSLMEDLIYFEANTTPRSRRSKYFDQNGRFPYVSGKESEEGIDYWRKMVRVGHKQLVYLSPQRSNSHPLNGTETSRSGLKRSSS